MTGQALENRPHELVRSTEIDWTYLLERRPAVLRHSTDLPPYLLLPEVRALLRSMRHANTRLLFATLWHTGARISEALALTPASFHLDARGPYVSLTTLKQRGRPKKGVTKRPARMVPIEDTHYIDQLQTYLATHRPKPDERLFPITRQAADYRLRAAIGVFIAAGHALSVPVSCHTFRHSFAVNCVLHDTPLTALKGWLGHRHLETTAIYTEVIAVETAHFMRRIEF